MDSSSLRSSAKSCRPRNAAAMMPSYAAQSYSARRFDTIPIQEPSAMHMRCMRVAGAPLIAADAIELVGHAEWREAKRHVRIGADKGLRNSQFQYEIGLSSGSEKRR
jgi:hypothetical protein